jgi:hypothetical protein
VLNTIEQEIVRTGQEHGWKMRMGKSRELESEKFSVFGH